MARVRMEWDWVGEWPIFVYMTWLTHNEWKVKVVKGERGNQNAPGKGPSAPAWFEFTSLESSKIGVARQAFELAKDKLEVL